MTTYSSKPVEVAAPADKVYARISDFDAFQDKVDTLPEDVKAKIGSVKFAHDSITINAAPMGDITLTVTERVPDKRVALEAPNSPVKLVLAINLEPIGPETTRIITAIEVDIPIMLKPMVGPKLQEAADRFGEMIQNLSNV